MNYKIEGSGETLVFIHGLSDNLLFWEFLASNLKNDYRVLRIDLRGHGETELGSDAVTMDLLTNDLKNLLDNLEIKNANLIGFSLGGAVALDFTVRYSKMVSSLVLMSTFYRSDEYLADILNKLKYALENSFEDFYDVMLPMVLCPDVIEDNLDELNFLKELASQTANTQAYIQAVDVCLNFNVENELSEIDVPTLVLAGKYDEISLLDSQIDLKSKIKDSKLIVFDDVKHNLLVGRNNEEILDILKSFYKKREEK
ncbi:alpha/beta fold hydrolase [Methanobrevibacter sp.]|uniref:alpha/beta fold hydrolase n=1 Tax=Methanobrevibacter sp. TaxID=66852 RepID=UPI00388EFE99